MVFNLRLKNILETKVILNPQKMGLKSRDEDMLRRLGGASDVTKVFDGLINENIDLIKRSESV